MRGPSGVCYNPAQVVAINYRDDNPLLVYVSTTDMQPGDEPWREVFANECARNAWMTVMETYWEQSLFCNRR